MNPDVSWNQIMLIEHPTGERATYDVLFENGEVAVSWYVNDEFEPSCPHCVRGDCVQRVIQFFDTDHHVVVHDCRKELS
jgi:hypothetical protein